MVTLKVEAVEKGDRVVVPFAKGPRSAVVIDSSAMDDGTRTLVVDDNGAPFRWNMPAGHTVDLTC